MDYATISPLDACLPQADSRCSSPRDYTRHRAQGNIRREKAEPETRGLFCSWAAKELGYSILEIARRLGTAETGRLFRVLFKIARIIPASGRPAKRRT